MLISPLTSQSARHPESNMVLVEGELPPATSDERLLIAPYHIHHTDDEIFYVLAGRIGFEVNDETYIASAGDAVIVPPGAIHTWWNADSTPARYLIAMSKRVDDLIIALHDHHRNQEETETLFAEHDAKLIGWSR